MMCEECGIREATIHFTTIVNGHSRELMLCSECLNKHKHQMWDGIPLGELLQGFWKENGKEETPQLRCPSCGMDYEEFKNSGRLGCAQCYRTFSQQLEPVLSRLHGRVRHAGKVPGGQKAAPAEMDPVAKLKQEMEQAVAKEDFERAAALRDQIKALQKEAE